MPRTAAAAAAAVPGAGRPAVRPSCQAPRPSASGGGGPRRCLCGGREGQGPSAAPALAAAALARGARGARRPLGARRAADGGQAPGCEVVSLSQTDLCEAASESSAPPTQASEPPVSFAELLTRGAEFYLRMGLLLAQYVPVKLETVLAEASGQKLDPDGDLERRWHRTHQQAARDLSVLISDLKGFHVKAGQTIATRTDLFPKEYSVELAYLVDSVNPLPFPVIRQVVEAELLGGLPLDSVFERFEEEPLGSASIAQVHRAVLRGGREVAVKVQRPNAEALLMKDIRDIRDFSRLTRGIFPADYFVVFSEIERQMQFEFDFRLEASGMDRVANCLCRDGRVPPVHVPRSVQGLVSRKVLCMDFVPGVPLTGLRGELERRGIDVDPESPAGQAFGRRLLEALSDAYAFMIFEDGFFHADPHPGNVFVMPDLSTALIDFGQTKQLNYRFRRELAELIVLLGDLGDTEEDYARFIERAPMMGTVYAPDAHRFCPVALAVWLFGAESETLPGGYDANELSPDSPVKDVLEFDQEFVLVTRATLLIRGLAARLGVPWSLAQAWRGRAQAALEAGPGGPRPPGAAGAAARAARGPSAGEKLRLGMKQWWYEAKRRVSDVLR